MTTEVHHILIWKQSLSESSVLHLAHSFPVINPLSSEEAPQGRGRGEWLRSGRAPYVDFVPSPTLWKPTQSVKAVGKIPLWKIDTSIHVLYQCKVSNQLLYKPRLVTGSNCTCVWVTSLEDPLTSLDSDRTSGSSQSSHFLHQCQYLGVFSFHQVATCVHRTLKMFYLNLAF